jgi:ABC-type antimicrobial peptide transport system permease subunit
LGRDKLFTFINLGGLAIGLACTILLYLWVKDEFEFNSHYEHAENIYRVRHWQNYGDNSFACTASPPALSPAIKSAYPEIKYATRFNDITVQVNTNDKGFSDRLSTLDSDAFEMFSFQFTQGDKNSYSDKGNVICISERFALKYYGDNNPIGQSLTINNEYPFTIGAVFKDFPNNISYGFDMVAPIHLLSKVHKYSLDSWGSNTLTSFIRLKKGTDYKAFEEKISSFLSDRRGKTENEDPILLEQLSKMYLYSMGGSQRIETVKIFGLIGFLILLIACFNYTNITTAKASGREKEIGVRKVLSASKSNLWNQFMGETLLNTFLAINVGLIIARFLLPVFNNLSGKTLILDYSDYKLWMGLLGIWLITSFLAGVYPSIVLSRIPSLHSMKNSAKKKKGIFRKILVSLQFATSIILIICVLVMSLQIHHLKNIDLGIKKENIVYFHAQESTMKHYHRIKDELLTHPEFEHVTHIQTMPFNGGWNGGGWNWEGKAPDVTTLIYFRHIDRGFINTFGVKMKEGKFFKTQPKQVKDEEPKQYYDIVINETFAQIAFPDGNAINQFITHGGTSKFRIIGVVEDYYFLSPTQKKHPLILYNIDINNGFIYVKTNSEHINKSLAKLSKIVKKYQPEALLNYRFVDEDYDKMYRYYERFTNIYLGFAIFAIFISCLGLYGLASFYTKLRTKEIGIRKAMGAPVKNIIRLLASEIIKLILISSVIAVPIAFYYGESLIQNMANRIELSWWIFASGILTILVIAIGTILYQTFSAASRNPVESLRYE